MSEPRHLPVVQLHDVSVNGDPDPAPLLAAIEQAVANTGADPTSPRRAVAAAIARAVAANRQP